MPLTNAGRNLVSNSLVGAAYISFASANAHLGVGGGTGATTVFSPDQTDLQGLSKNRKPMEPSYPRQAANVLTFRATFLTTEANYAWEEWGVFNAATAGVMLSRKVESLGVKTPTQAWQFTVDLIVNNP